jgi:hypothetical protein
VLDGVRRDRRPASRSRGRGIAAAALFAVLAAPLAPPAGAAAPERALLEQADRVWSRRAEGFDGEHATREAAEAAVAAYEAALAAAPDDLEAIWKLERALHYQGEFTRLPAAKRARLWERGTKLAERAIRILHRGDGSWSERDPESFAASVEDRATAAAVHFWAAVHWGLWGETKGALPAVRKGIARRIRDHARFAIALDETYERAGPHRLLGRLHAVAPRVPFFTGWISRDEAARHLERAVELAPEDVYNRLYLAELRLELEPQERAEIEAELRAIASAPAGSEHPVEDARARRAARALLDASSAGAGAGHAAARP